MAIMTKLRNDNLKEAFDSLAEIYHWQQETLKLAPARSNIHYLGTSEASERERVPFGWEP
ncbi:hypothetical protein [Reyranella sp.]|uniref:hypothetical protein n=1 Tax=Reyranella sp. TaxID=1929291 RepID=UPI003525337C